MGFLNAVDDLRKDVGLVVVESCSPWEIQQCGFRTGQTQTELYKYRRQLEA